MTQATNLSAFHGVRPGGEPVDPDGPASIAGPAIFWLILGFVLSGIGTVLVGPILPTLAADWHLSDAHSGLLLMAKFIGSFLGGMLVPRSLRKGILRGTLCGAAGFAAFALSSNLLTGCTSLLVGGFGLGQIIASTNILGGRRYTEHTGSALSWMNFFWAFGAVICGALAAAIVPVFHLRGPLLSFAGLFLFAGLGGSLQQRNAAPPREDVDEPTASEERAAVLPAGPVPAPILRSFALLMFCYGGLETCLSGWLTTYTLRFSDVHMLGGQSAIVLLWSSLTVGRALASVAMRYVTEQFMQRVGLAFCALFIALITLTRHAGSLSVLCLLLGVALAPFFPATFALLLQHRPTARIAGMLLALSGLGAAIFPWLMGEVSTRAGSLRTAMLVPFVLALAMLVLSLRRQAAPVGGL